MIMGEGYIIFFSGIVTDKLPMLQCIINPSSMFIQTYLIKLSGSLGKGEDSRGSRSKMVSSRKKRR